MPMGALKRAEYNPRTITDKAKVGLASSIQTFGLVEPIIWNERTGNIVGGHQRYDRLLEQGAIETDVVVVSLSPSHEIALNITLNNTNIQGDWIDGQRDQLIEDLKRDELDLVDNLQLNDLQIQEDVQIIDTISLPSEDRSGLTQMAFTVTFEQKEIIERAIAGAKAIGPFIDTNNTNNNGNALSRVSEMFITQNGIG
jgi:hypothetical protein